MRKGRERKEKKRISTALEIQAQVQRGKVALGGIIIITYTNHTVTQFAHKTVSRRENPMYGTIV